MIRNKWLLMGSVFIFILLIIYRLPYPNTRFIGSGSSDLFLFNLSSRTGVELMEWISLILFVIAIVLFVRSLTDHRAVLTVLMVIAVGWLPMKVVELYQFTLATGVDAVSYNDEESSCTFDGRDTMCEVELKNHSSNEVEFLLNVYDVFYEGNKEFLFDEDDWEPILLKPRTTHKIEINRYKANGSGSLGSFNIQIRDDDKERDL
ncbi:hypothetical protein [Alkalicoccobacillus gibsonii]|uniref:hypothetical protein n=1 Tax=Alkalicoccobacillus gibsonii TaxID=79881 RepID=UPI0019343FA5|nr:hypothetical protein [Alkalicoccobacillus gibsonii]MBM0064889.1 hypothetical protein [Alkalicoccobacillus gibsonii]